MIAFIQYQTFWVPDCRSSKRSSARPHDRNYAQARTELKEPNTLSRGLQLGTAKTPMIPKTEPQAFSFLPL